ncbi:hypothetical protein ACJMK2_032665 [Sinanodonta woodiana]|uniref:Uncharacterized protein n=1 Tax=Sinanodonta woodiana TaxID=1069815 RepID=A0ABD3X2F9_SINWO
MIDFRIYNITHVDVIGALANDIVGNIVSGGKTEGTSLLGQGDTYYLSVLKLMRVCRRYINPPSPRHRVLYTEDRHVHHDCTWLRGGGGITIKWENITKQAMILTIIQEVLMRRFPLGAQFQQIAGPSHLIRFTGIQYDNVLSFSHPGWSIQASHWMERCVTNGWSLPAIVQSGYYIVPKGFNGSPSSRMEWCISKQSFCFPRGLGVFLRFLLYSSNFKLCRNRALDWVCIVWKCLLSCANLVVGILL